MCKFYDAERVIFSCICSKTEISISDLLAYAKRVEKRSKTEIHFDLSPSSIINALALSKREMEFDGKKIICK